jgi:hypothetical protein
MLLNRHVARTTPSGGLAGHEHHIAQVLDLGVLGVDPGERLIELGYPLGGLTRAEKIRGLGRSV